MTETTKQRMMAEVICDSPEAMDRVIGKFTALGFKVRELDWRDPCGTDVRWVLAFIDSEDDQDEFFNWAYSIVNSIDGDVLEAGFSGDDAAVEKWIARKS